MNTSISAGAGGMATSSSGGIRIGSGGGGGGGGAGGSGISGGRSWPSTTSVSASGKRIQREMSELNMDPPHDCSAGPKGDNLYHWVATLIGPHGYSYISPLFLSSDHLHTYLLCGLGVLLDFCAI